MSNEPAAPSSVRPRRVVTDRRGGRSASPYDTFNLGDHVGDDPAAVAANRSRVARELGVGEDRLVWMEQVHGTGVAVVDGPQDGPVPATDALVTRTPGLVLGVLAADCVPVLLTDPVAGVVAAVHAGREGVRQGVLPRALSAMASLGARARHVTALLGPAVCGACYEVPEAMQADVARVAPAAAVRTRRGTPGLDLRAGLAEALQRAGVTEVVTDARCTVEDPQLFSHRRDGVTGRHAGLVWLG
ncbi:peptidoglycan editing factor PgeF [Blastococcus sp. TF02A-30]|uniref:peptidoglycan editing factor PgeF n=1 Tax=Blastococcus sp. TF02A-30 TaxID=2250580 RepID=UPI000DEAF02E|nr:peptidoglycan editing factor PgeF [Blastococcus sp. TF02A-30]RBY85586.1 peptidoglycan editing factor PgeF [Blastococcus sp. TF02A-30]